MTGRGTASNIAITTVANAVLPLSALVTAPFLAYGLGVDGRGELAAAIAPLTLAITIAPMGFPDAATYFVARSHRLRLRLRAFSVLSIVMVGLVITAVILLLAPVLAAGDQHLAGLIRVGSLILVPALIVGFIRGVAAGHQAWKLIALDRALSGSARLIGIVVLFTIGALDPMSATVVMASSYALGGLAYSGLRRQVLTELNEDAADVRMDEFLRYAGFVWFGALSGFLLTRVDQLLMTPLSDVRQLGYYAVAANLAETILIFNSAVRDVTFATEAGGRDSERLTQLARISTLFTMAAGTVIAATSPLVVPLLFGRDFSPAIPLVLILVAAIVIGNPGSVAGSGLAARGRPGLRSATLALACVANIVLLVLLLPSLGAIGAAIATLAGSALAGFLNTFWLARHFGFRSRDFYFFRRSDFTMLLSGIRSGRPRLRRMS
ncbi:oligosaccharide flippase family protein [Mycolicibacterium sp.]|uniref:oligosaccharide flippase family protein n=1 Tax=Mycolicibacterium sp. TaxID=2320850 RepID=UPI001A1F1561|nr:oligosaccharide flippase family protein [Mycolicibacterium sp.]MBJ7336718.1 oligosaccharide flippase family protein [Mycolicibacterium sp.]